MALGRLILVGVVGAPHGVRGELRLKSYTGEPLAIAGYRTLHTEQPDRSLSIVAHRALKDDMLVVRFAGIEDRSAAAALTNTRLYVDRTDLPPAEDDEFYHADLIGLEARTPQGEVAGRIVTLHNFGAGDLIEIEPTVGDTFFVPFTNAFVPEVHLADGFVVIAEDARPGLDDETDRQDRVG